MRRYWQYCACVILITILVVSSEADQEVQPNGEAQVESNAAKALLDVDSGDVSEHASNRETRQSRTFGFGRPFGFGGFGRPFGGGFGRPFGGGFGRPFGGGFGRPFGGGFGRPFGFYG